MKYRRNRTGNHSRTSTRSWNKRFASWFSNGKTSLIRRLQPLLDRFPYWAPVSTAVLMFALAWVQWGWHAADASAARVLNERLLAMSFEPADQGRVALSETARESARKQPIDSTTVQEQYLDEHIVQIAGFDNYRQLQLIDGLGTPLTVLVACGKHAALVAHRPEICLPSQGWEQSSRIEQQSLDLGDRAATVSVVEFRHPDGSATDGVRTYTAFNAGNGWTASHAQRRNAGEPPRLIKAMFTLPRSANTQSIEPLIGQVLAQVDASLFHSPLVDSQGS